MHFVQVLNYPLYEVVLEGPLYVVDARGQVARSS